MHRLPTQTFYKQVILTFDFLTSMLVEFIKFSVDISSRFPFKAWTQKRHCRPNRIVIIIIIIMKTYKAPLTGVQRRRTIQ